MWVPHSFVLGYSVSMPDYSCLTYLNEPIEQPAQKSAFTVQKLSNLSLGAIKHILRVQFWYGNHRVAVRLPIPL